LFVEFLTRIPQTIPPSGKVKSVQETKAEFKIGFEDGSNAKAALERRQSA
jgi:hypothetical protein